MNSAQRLFCVNKGLVDLEFDNRSVKTVWQTHVFEGLSANCKIGVDYMRDRGIRLNLFEKTLVMNRDENTRKFQS